MRGSHCRLYDENLVRNIMITTGISIMEFVKENRNAKTEEVCEFVEYNADDIIAETIKNLNHDNDGKDSPMGPFMDPPGDGLDRLDDDLSSLDGDDDDDKLW